MQGVSQYLRSRIWTWQEYSAGLGTRGCFVKMGRTFPDTLPIENQSAVLHQKLLSHVGLGLDVVAQQPQHLCLKPNLFFSRFPPSFWTLLQRKIWRDCVILSIPKLSAQNHIAFVRIFLYWPRFWKWLLVGQRPPKLFAISFFVTTFSTWRN